MFGLTKPNTTTTSGGFLTGGSLNSGQTTQGIGMGQTTTNTLNQAGQTNLFTQSQPTQFNQASFGALGSGNQQGGSNTFFKPSGGALPSTGLSTTSMFGQQPQVQSQMQQSGTFSSIGQTAQTGAFNSKPSTNFFQQPNTMNQQTFSVQPQMGSTAPNLIGMQQQMPVINPSLTLPPTNIQKYDKIETLNVELIKTIKEIETSFRKNDMYLEQCESLISELRDNYKTLVSEGVKVIKYCKLINSKKSKIDFITQNLKNEIERNNDQIERCRKNYHILGHIPMKISVPSEYFIDLTNEIEEKISFQMHQISDIESLVNLYYKKESGSFKVNSDLVEENIKCLYECLIELVSEACKLNEYTKSIKNSYVEMMKYSYGWKEIEVENRFRHLMAECDDDQDKINVRESRNFNMY
jgi:hypothetical protein